jgi:alpha-tubulin suppressor-like RCC1 family protein
MATLHFPTCSIVILFIINDICVTAIVSTNDPYQVYSAGRNDHGQLGVRDKLVRPTPTIIREIYRPVQLSSASYHSLANTVDGVVYGWGGETQGQLSLISDYGVPSNDGSSHSFDVLHPVVLSLLIAEKVKIVATGREHTVICTWSGKVFVFGRYTMKLCMMSKIHMH